MSQGSGDAAEKRNEPPPSKIEALDGSNYEEWSGRMRSAFKRYKLLKLAMGEEKMPKEGDARDRWFEKSAVLYDLILQSVNNDMFQHIKDLVELDDSAPKAWKLLRDVIQPNTLPMVIVLEKELAALSMRPGDDVKPVLDKIKDTYARMAAAGSKVSQMQQCTKIILVLGNSWDNLIPTLNTQRDQWTPEWLRQQILQEDFRRRHTCRGAANKTAEGYGAAGGSRGRGGGRSQGRGRGFGRGRGRGDYNEGHGISGGRGSTRMEGACWYCKKARHPWFECFSRPKGWAPPGMKPPSGERARGGAVQGSDAQGDGAHGKADPGTFLMVEDVKGSEGDVGSVGKKSKAKVTFVPTSRRAKLGKLLLWDLEEKCSCIKDLWQLPIIPWNGKLPATAAAAATAKATEGGEETAPSNGALDAVKKVQQPQHPHGEVLAGGDASAAWAKASSGSGKADWETWHERLCHVNFPMLQKLVKDGSLKGLEVKGVVKEIGSCPTCLETKFTKFPFNSGTGPAKAPLALVHMHVVGPMRAPSLSGSRYFLTIVDDHTRAVWVYPLKTKGEVDAAVLKEWMPRGQRESGHKVKVIRTDNGGEFIGADFEAVLKKKGIQHQLTVPYNPQQNGVALLKNRVLATVGDKQLVPYTKWYGSAPAVNMLRAYGCMVVFHGWLIWDLTSLQLTVLRDVKFLESLYYKEWKQQQQMLPTTPLIIEGDEVQRPSKQVQVTVSDEEISGVTEDGEEPEVEEQQQHHQQQQDAPPRTQRPPDRPRRDVRPPNRLTYPSFGKPKVMDITTAFLNGIILEKLYMLQPEGLDDGSSRVCRLKKTIYGLKQAPRAWYHKLEETLLAGGFKKSECDHSLFLLQEKEQFLMLLVYVDDILLLSESSAMIEHVEEMLEMQFKCSKMGDVKYYLGMYVERDLDKGVLRLHQRKYCEGLAEKYGLQNGGKAATPLPTSFTVEPCADEEVVGESDRKLFHSMVGALNYAANHTRPDIAFATSRLASVVSRPSLEQLEAAKRLVRYVSATTSVGLEYSAVRQRQQRAAADLGKGEMLLTCYTNASFNSVKADGTSIGGYVCLFRGGAVCWRSKKQNEVGLSSCETRYMALHHGVKEVVWLRRLLEEIGVCQREPIVMFCDNESAVKLAKNRPRLVVPVMARPSHPAPYLPCALPSRLPHARWCALPSHLPSPTPTPALATAPATVHAAAALLGFSSALLPLTVVSFASGCPLSSVAVVPLLTPVMASKFVLRLDS
ncbi:unnamed protein product [Closterium sp. NIES-54]